jgi:hypothetical protein
MPVRQRLMCWNTCEGAECGRPMFHPFSPCLLTSPLWSQGFLFIFFVFARMGSRTSHGETDLDLPTLIPPGQDIGRSLSVLSGGSTQKAVQVVFACYGGAYMSTPKTITRQKHFLLCDCSGIGLWSGRHAHQDLVLYHQCPACKTHMLYLDCSGIGLPRTWRGPFQLSMFGVA